MITENQAVKHTTQDVNQLEAAEDSSNLVICTKNLSKSFGQLQAVQNLDLKVPKNSIFGFLGPNGAGKSTTMKMLMGLLYPTQGEIQIFNQDLTENHIGIKTRIGYLAQQPKFFPYMTARDLLRFRARFFYNGPKKLIEERIAESLELVALTRHADRLIKGFSGGERQRLGIAQAIVNKPDLLILDEPAAALDPMGRHDVLKIMERLREQSTIFYSTHILDDVQKVSDTVAILNEGKLICQGPIENLLKGSQTTYEVLFKGDPGQTQQLIREQPYISSIITEHDDNTSKTRWELTVSDEQAAEDELFQLLAQQNLKVVKFGLKEQELEHIFLDLINGGQ